jgi:hypothetical protein
MRELYLSAKKSRWARAKLISLGAAATLAVLQVGDRQRAGLISPRASHVCVRLPVLLST